MSIPSPQTLEVGEDLHAIVTMGHHAGRDLEHDGDVDLTEDENQLPDGVRCKGNSLDRL